ncbi:hypothetical protein CWC05_01250 [Pseudoalteromonas ruthenica]|uniref:ABC transporter ATP-binding protein n=1 Tax=Pseudoalteromonas ruthenica TaxID=151081 RepID=A0A5S3ZAM8_9GAMM|nr:ABC transporter transmembrane domain-containing protein [Pseudoalteromonas ruthenica]TMP89010.1 hypothetical protein CWC05_01250 [Pseudoalteromonas ruthenica]
MINSIKSLIKKNIFSYQSQRLTPHADRQLRKNDCGISVIKTLCNLAGVNAPRSEIQDSIRLTEGGMWFDELKVSLENYGFDLKYKLLDHTQSQSKAIAEACPCVAMIDQGLLNHYIYIHKVIGDYACVMDPAEGKFSMILLETIVEKLARSKVRVDEALTNAFLEQQIEIFAQQELSTPIDIPNDIEEKTKLYGKIKYINWLEKHTGFGSKSKKSDFVRTILSGVDEKLVPSRFRVFRIKEEKLISKSPVLLTVKGMPVKEQVKSEQLENASPISKLFNLIYTKPDLRSRLWVFIFSGFIASIIAYVAIYANQILIDEVLPKRNLTFLYVFASVLVFTKLFELGFQLLTNFMEVNFTQVLDKTIYRSFSSALLRMSNESLGTYTRGDLSQRTNELFRIKKVIKQYITNVLITFISVLLSLLMAVLYSPEVALVFVVVGSLFWLLLRHASHIIKSLESLNFVEKSNLINNTIESIEGHRVIKRYGLENRVEDEQNSDAESFFSVQRKTIIMRYVLSFTPKVCTVIGTICVILIAGKAHIISGELTMGQVFTLISLSETCFSGLKKILITMLSIQEQSVTIERFFDLIIDYENYNIKTVNSLTEEQKVTQLTIKNLEFKYPGRNFKLDIPELEFNIGDKILLDGTNGAGKSTLLAIISNSLSLGVQGQITYISKSGYFLREHEFSKRICMVRAEDKIFNDTLQYNICFRRGESNLNIYNMAKQIGADDFINGFDLSIDSIINESASELSTGQKRKILILRALFTDADIYIFDEIFRGIDNDSKQKIANTITNLLSDKIIIYTTHEIIPELRINRHLELNKGSIKQLKIKPNMACNDYTQEENYG